MLGLRLIIFFPTSRGGVGGRAPQIVSLFLKFYYLMLFSNVILAGAFCGVLTPPILLQTRRVWRARFLLFSKSISKLNGKLSCCCCPVSRRHFPFFFNFSQS